MHALGLHSQLLHAVGLHQQGQCGAGKHGAGQGCSHAGGTQWGALVAQGGGFHGQNVDGVDHGAAQREGVAPVPRSIFKKHQAHAHHGQRAGGPDVPAGLAVQYQPGNQGHDEHVQPRHKGIAVAGGVVQAFNLQPEGHKVQHAQPQAPAPFGTAHAPPQRQQHECGHAKAQPDDLQGRQVAGQLLHGGEGRAPDSSDQQQGQQPQLLSTHE